MTLLETAPHPRRAQPQAQGRSRRRRAPSAHQREAAASSPEPAPRLPAAGDLTPLGLAVARSQRLFDALPELSARHTAADLMDKGDSRTRAAYGEIDAAYQRHLQALSQANLAILRSPVTTTQDVYDKLEAFILATAAVVIRHETWQQLDLETALVALERTHWTEEFGPALSAVARDLALVASRPGADPGRSGRRRNTTGAGKAWAEALSAYELAHAEREWASDKSKRLHVESFAACPSMLREPQLHWGVHARWSDAAEIAADPLLSDAERPELTQLLETWCEAKPSNMISETDDEELDELHDRELDAYENLMATPAPDVAALARKQAIAFREESEDRFGLEDLGFVAHCLEQEPPLRSAIEAHRDTLRLAGLDHPILHMDGFSARRWIDHFEVAGGKASDAGQALLLIHPRWPGAVRRREAGQLIKVLGETPWKYRAVALAARSRRIGGGDPLFDAHGDHGADDRRGSRPRLPLPPRVDRIIFREAAGRPAPVIRRYGRRGGQLVELGLGEE